MNGNSTIIPEARTAEEMSDLQEQWAKREQIRWVWDGDHNVWSNLSLRKSVTVQGMRTLLVMCGRSEEEAEKLATQHTDLWVDLLEAALLGMTYVEPAGKHVREVR